MKDPHPGCTLERVRELETEVARLEERKEEARGMAEEWKRRHDAERAAHEQTRAELEHARGDIATLGEMGARRQELLVRARADIATAQARVAELEAELDETESDAGVVQDDRDLLLTRALAAESALASARKLLEQYRFTGVISSRLLEALLDALSTHPTPGAEKGAGT